MSRSGLNPEGMTENRKLSWEHAAERNRLFREERERLEALISAARPRPDSFRERHELDTLARWGFQEMDYREFVYYYPMYARELMFKLVNDYSKNVGMTGIPTPAFLRSLRLHAQTALKWMNTPPSRLGKSFTKHFCMWTHPETPLSMEVHDKKGRMLATMGGYAYYHEGKPALRITNVQGTKVRKEAGESDADFEERKARDLKVYDRLNEELGGNWRAYLVKQAVLEAKKRGMMVVAQEPTRFDMGGLPLTSDSEYERQIGNYRRIYRKAGLAQHPDGSWRSCEQA